VSVGGSCGTEGYGAGGYDRRWKHLLQFPLRVIMCPCAVLSIKANMCALGLYDSVVDP